MFKRLAYIAAALSIITVATVFLGTTILNRQAWEEINKEYYEMKRSLIDYYIQSAKNDLSSMAYANAVWTDLQTKMAQNEIEWMYDNATGYVIDNESFGINFVMLSNEDMSFLDINGDDISEEVMNTDSFKNAINNDLSGFEIIWANDVSPYLVYAMPTKNNENTNPTGAYVLARKYNLERRENLLKLLGEKNITKLTMSKSPEYNSVISENYSVIKFSYPIKLENSEDYFNVEVNTPVFYDTFVLEKNRILMISVAIIIFGILAILTYYRKMVNSIATVINTIKKISAGNYEAKAPASKLEEINDLSEAVNKMAKDITIHLESINTNYLDMIQIMADTVELNDTYTSEHNIRVGDVAEMIGEKFGIKDLEALKIAARLHDIGKISIPTEILNKPSELTQQEFEIVKTHPLAGFRIMDGIDFFNEIKYGVLYHHERYDGNGYPRGLKGEEIPIMAQPIMAQIISIADVFDALITDRAYRKAFSFEEAVDMIVEESGGAFNPELIDIFVTEINKKGFK